jgi:regulator of RNase E activity RraA
MNFSTAQICDALVSHPDARAEVKVFTTEFPILSAAHNLQGPLGVIVAGGDAVERQLEIGRLAEKGFIILIDNFGRVDCACFEQTDLAKCTKRPKGIIVNGALRSSSKLAQKPYVIRARTVNPMPFAAVPIGASEVPWHEPFPFRETGFVIGDGDGLIVLRSKETLTKLGLSEDPAMPRE